MKRIFVVAACLAISGCTMRYPANAKASDGSYLEGEAIASLSEGRFNVRSDSGLSCSGEYDPLNTARVVTFLVSCSDGASGYVTIERTPDLLSGIGSGKMSNGGIFDAAYGDLTTKITRNSNPPTGPVRPVGLSDTQGSAMH